MELNKNPGQPSWHHALERTAKKKKEEFNQMLGKQEHILFGNGIHQEMYTMGEGEGFEWLREQLIKDIQLFVWNPITEELPVYKVEYKDCWGETAHLITKVIWFGEFNEIEQDTGWYHWQEAESIFVEGMPIRLEDIYSITLIK